MSDLKARLESHDVGTLRREVARRLKAEVSVAGYSKLKKAALIEKLLKIDKQLVGGIEAHIGFKIETGPIKPKGAAPAAAPAPAPAPEVKKTIKIKVKKSKPKAAAEPAPEAKKEKKPPSEKQLAARKKFGDAAKARAAAKKSAVDNK